MTQRPQTVLQDDEPRGVRRITLNRPDKRNAFDAAVIAELTGAFSDAEKDPEVRVVILAASGKHFSAGADLEWMRATAAMSESENRDDARQLANLMRTLDQITKPVIARVQGAAFGGALGLICCADIAVAESGARFCLSEVRLGLVPATIGPYVVRAMGHRQARRYMLTAELMDADTARDLGLVHEVMANETLDEGVEAICHALLQGGPDAQTHCKKLLQRLDNPAGYDAVHEFTAEMIAATRTGAEGQEGLRAFFHKDNPKWRSE
jgi:methylglutaconyl-CoA hydratase